MSKAIEVAARGGLPSLEKARAALVQCRTMAEVGKIKALAMAVASCAAAESTRTEAAGIVLECKARMGEITAELPKAPERGKRTPVFPAGTPHKSAALASEGVSRKSAAENEKLASLKADGTLARLIAKGETTTTAALAVHALKPAARKRVLRSEAPVADGIRAERRADRVAKLVEISSGNAAIEDVDRVFPVIYADPPWRYEHAVSESRAIENQYPTMELDAICALKPPATGDAILFLWATSPKLAEAMRVVTDWGFVYRTCMVWDKLVIGMGYYARQRHELLLIATRGAPPAPAPGDRPDSVISIKRGEHSTKPTRFYEIIEAMYPELPKIELFARTPRDGWSRWGNQS